MNQIPLSKNMRIVERALNIYKSEGAKSLAKKSISFVFSKNKKLYDIFVRSYYNWKGTQEFEIENISGVFDATTDRGGHHVRWQYKTEKEILAEFIRSINDGDIIYDIGAHVGLYTVFAGELVSEGTVIAFEPHPPNRAQLKQNIALNDLKASISDFALSNSTGTVDFESESENSIAGHGSLAVESEDQSDSVQAIRGDDLIKKNSFPQPNVIKMDVEGAEGLIIDGFRKTLADSACRLLFIEVHLPADHRQSITDYGTTWDNLRNDIRELGFSIDVLSKRGQDLHIKATKE
jgi:FkbM family methyltransferase